MDADPKTPLVLIALTILFLGLRVAFQDELWGKPASVKTIPSVDAAFTNTATVRVSFSELKRTGADTSDYECYVCHEKNKPPVVKIDTNNIVTVPKEHEAEAMRHGRNNRNNNCYNCHDQTNLEKLRTRDGHQLEIADSSRLCASCHGPTYRDWEIGIHGRMTGFWNVASSQKTRQDCVSCHNPHAPAFQQIKPAPAPHALHERAAHAEQKEAVH
jgi:hypothetical protein